MRLARPQADEAFIASVERYGLGVTDDAYQRGLAWAREPPYPQVPVSLLSLADQGPPRAFAAFDYIVDHVQRSRAAVPEAAWNLIIDSVAPGAQFIVGVAAYLTLEKSLQPVAERAWRFGSDAGDADPFNLGVLLAERGDTVEAESWYRRAAEADTRMGFPLSAHLVAHPRSGSDSFSASATTERYSSVLLQVHQQFGHRVARGDDRPDGVRG